MLNNATKEQRPIIGIIERIVLLCDKFGRCQLNLVI